MPERRAITNFDATIKPAHAVAKADLFEDLYVIDFVPPVPTSI